jgi:hypothetical protein
MDMHATLQEMLENKHTTDMVKPDIENVRGLNLAVVKLNDRSSD